MKEQLQAALTNPNVIAFLRVIRAGESSQDDGAYHTLVGNTRFESLDRHPRTMVWLPNLRVNSSAAGAYQFLGRTWDECAKALDLQDFGKASQDLAAVFLIRRRGALDDVIAGRFEAAIKKCAKEWASLPESPYGQPAVTMAKAKAVYAQYGGVLYTSPEPVQKTPEIERVRPGPEALTPEPSATNPAVLLRTKERAMIPPFPPFLISLGKILISGMMPLAAEKISKELNRHVDRPEVVEQMTTTMIEAAKTATGLTDPLEAVAAARKDPAAMAQIEASALETLEKFAPLLERMAAIDLADKAATEASYNAAAARAAGQPNDQDQFLTRAIVALLIGAIVGCGVLVAVLAYLKVDVQVIIGALIALVSTVGSKFSTRYDHRYGSSSGSGAKDVLIRELSARRE